MPVTLLCRMLLDEFVTHVVVESDPTPTPVTGLQ